MIKQKYYSGGLMVMVGLGVAIWSQDYHIGTLDRMGPGYFPFLLGLLLMGLGLFMAVTPDSPDEVQADANRPTFQSVLARFLRPWLATIGGMVAFIIIGRYGGLAPATFALVFLAAMGDHNNSVKACVGLAMGVVMFAVLVFHYGMQLQFPLFTWG